MICDLHNCRDGAAPARPDRSFGALVADCTATSKATPATPGAMAGIGVQDDEDDSGRRVKVHRFERGAAVTLGPSGWSTGPPPAPPRPATGASLAKVVTSGPTAFAPAPLTEVAHSHTGAQWAAGAKLSPEELSRNGGRQVAYMWSQERTTAVLSVPVPAGTRAKDLAVDIEERSVAVRLRGEALVAGETAMPIDVQADRSDWELMVRQTTCHFMTRSVSRMRWVTGHQLCFVCSHPALCVALPGIVQAKAFGSPWCALLAFRLACTACAVRLQRPLESRQLAAARSLVCCRHCLPNKPCTAVAHVQRRCVLTLLVCTFY